MEQASPVFSKRANQFNNHHILARKRGGTRQTNNLLRMDINRHCAWHLLFGNRTFLEAVALLKRTAMMKQGGER